jgi:hypothetical protein
LIENQ